MNRVVTRRYISYTNIVFVQLSPTNFLLNQFSFLETKTNYGAKESNIPELSAQRGLSSGILNTSFRFIKETKVMIE